MPPQPEAAPQAGREDQGRPPPDAAIGDHVLRALGQPPGLHRVQVRRLWEGFIRVNVFVGADAASATVAHSFFLTADDDGNVVGSTPEITRLY
jgi:hypothetical protein